MECSEYPSVSGILQLCQKGEGKNLTEQMIRRKTVEGQQSLKVTFLSQRTHLSSGKANVYLNKKEQELKCTLEIFVFSVFVLNTAVVNVTCITYKCGSLSHQFISRLYELEWGRKGRNEGWKKWCDYPAQAGM